MNWKPGDRAIIVTAAYVSSEGHDSKKTVGEIVHIISHPYLIGGVMAVDIEPLGWWNHADVACLRPIDDYDGMEVTSWSKCIFQPKELVRV